MEVGQRTKKTFAIAQGTGYITGYSLGDKLQMPALFRVASSVTGNVRVETVNETIITIDCQELDRDNMLITKVLDQEDTDLTANDFRLLV